ncbi:isochorismatase [Parashewanella spongiae]|uniref:Isochorismatase n=1 Tax=Parashewanella spongiae TaxID=342950 RepID=A0A3A6TU18_9GAMM|nr:isochorismatase [Parashewanella spongiae]MCL1078285.1 isochorismatase [Parashewanella spongiae]RJY15010.1 isochorismatase [Parashewanella spongiae]
MSSNKLSQEQALEICKQGIAAWQTAFNSQDAAGCAEKYLESTVMEAKPFGTFTGRQEVQAFWQNIMDQGFNDVNYTDVAWFPAENDEGFILTSKWTMNKAFGVVHREHWIVDLDGKARLKSDYFEVQGER